MKKDKKNIDEILKGIRSKFGDDSVMCLGDVPKVDVAKISTGSIGLDLALGIGGLPRGRIIEVFGPESSGKTTLCLHTVAEAQKSGGLCAFIDAEHALDPTYAEKIGVDIKNLLISQPNSGENALEIVDRLVRSGELDVIVVDSVAALTPQAEIDGEMDATHVGRQARLMSQAMRKLVAITAKSKTIVIFTNQIRMQIGVLFGNPETTPGGKALKFYSSVRIDIRKSKQIKGDTDEILGNTVRVKVVKNKVAAPFKTAVFDLMYNEGISKIGELITIGEKTSVIKRSGAYYSYKDKKLGQGFEKSRQFLQENPKIMEEIKKEIEDSIKK